MGAMENMVHDLVLENGSLKEEAGNLGFVRDTPSPSYTQIQRGVVLPCRRINYQFGSTEPAPGTVQSIMRKLTAEEFFILTHAHYMCQKDTIQKFVDILQGLIDQGEFDDYSPSYNGNPWGDSNKTGWESRQVEDYNPEMDNEEGGENE